MSRKYYEENFKKQLVNIYNQGNHTYRELHEQYGVSPSTIRQWVVRYNNIARKILNFKTPNEIVEEYYSKDAA